MAIVQLVRSSRLLVEVLPELVEGDFFLHECSRQELEAYDSLYLN